jgi:uncharacterized Tic20 family protein
MENSPSSDERTMAMICHLAAFAGVVIPFGNIIGPLVVWLLKKDSSPYIDYHGKEALNFQIAATIYILVAILSMMVLIGFVLAPVVGIAVLVLTIIAAIKAKDGEQYRYPYIFRLL